jgi:hypothetical protein
MVCPNAPEWAEGFIYTPKCPQFRSGRLSPPSFCEFLSNVNDTSLPLEAGYRHLQVTP